MFGLSGTKIKWQLQHDVSESWNSSKSFENKLTWLWGSCTNFDKKVPLQTLQKCYVYWKFMNKLHVIKHQLCLSILLAHREMKTLLVTDDDLFSFSFYNFKMCSSMFTLGTYWFSTYYLRFAFNFVINLMVFFLKYL